MKKTTLSLASLALPACWLGALVPQEISVSTDLTYASEYVFRGIELADNSFQPNIEVGHGDFYAGLWANLPTDAVATEIDYYAGLAFAVPGAEFLELDAGLTVYHYPDTGSDRTHEFYLGSGFAIPEIPELSASAYYFYDLDLEAHVGEGSATYAYPLEAIGLPASLDFTVVAGIVGGGSGVDGYNYYGGSIELPFALSDYSDLTAGVHYATAEKFDFAAGGGRGKNLFWSLGYSTFF